MSTNGNKRRPEGKEGDILPRPSFWTIKGLYVLQGLVVLLAMLNGLLLYALFLSHQGIRGYLEQNRQVSELEAKVLNLKRENQKLFQKIKGLRQDPLGQERLVRQQLGWVRENELIIEFPESPPSKNPAAP